MNVKDKVQKVGASGGSPAQGSKAGSRFTGIAKEIYTGDERQRNAAARANYCNEVRRIKRLEKRVRADAARLIAQRKEAEAKDQALLSALGLSSKPRIEYQLQEVDGRDFAHKALIERAKNELELILDNLSPQRVFVIGFKRGCASDLADELGLGRLKELGYQLIFKVTPESNRYLIAEVV